MQTNVKDKKIFTYWVIMIVAIFLIAATFTISLIIVNYKNQVLVTVLSVLSVVILSFVLMFVLLTKMIPYKQFIKWNKMISSYEGQIIKGKIVKIEKPYTFKNVGECQNIFIATSEKEINKFLPQKMNISDLKIGQEYSFLIKDIYIIEVKEEKDEK